MRRGGGVGYDFSSIRPEGALVHGTNSRASGPVSYMRVFDHSCETVESAGSAPRRADGRAALRPPGHRALHPRQGRRASSPTSTSRSASPTRSCARWKPTARSSSCTRPSPRRTSKDAGAYQRGDGLWVYRKVRARDLWDQIMRSTYDHAEPGILFLDRINRDNNLHYCETIESTNPCGEQPLPAYGCCDLGSIDLARFVADALPDDGARSTSRRSARVVEVVDPHARQRARRDALAAASSSTPRRWPSAASASASPGWAMR